MMKLPVLMLFLLSSTVAVEHPILDFGFPQTILENVALVDNEILNLNDHFTNLTTDSWCTTDSSSVGERISPAILRVRLYPDIIRIQHELTMLRAQIPNLQSYLFHDNFLQDVANPWMEAKMLVIADAINAFDHEVQDYIEGRIHCFAPHVHSRPLETILNGIDQRLSGMDAAIQSVEKQAGAALNEIRNLRGGATPEREQALRTKLTADVDRVVAEVIATRADLSHIYHAELDKLAKGQILDRVQKMRTDYLLNSLELTSKPLLNLKNV